MALMQRGVEFNHTSENYYNNLKQRLNNDGIKLYEDFDTLKSLNILIDYDPSTKPKSKSKAKSKGKGIINVIIYYKYFLNHYMIVPHYLLK